MWFCACGRDDCDSKIRVDRAVWAPLINEHGIDFRSARLRNYQFHPY
jgi:hypothetical protein